jgi:aspartyl-tRNA(Asn)/glutamyl-tRNA(Gln) amidotransferase subunit C
MSAPELNVRYTAQLARIQLTEEEISSFQGQLAEILAYVEQLERLDVTGVEPTAHANPVFDVLRDDVARPGIGQDAALSNAPRKANGLFIVPKVIE